MPANVDIVLCDPACPEGGPRSKSKVLTFVERILQVRAYHFQNPKNDETLSVVQLENISSCC